MVRHPVQRMLSQYLQTPVPFDQWWRSNKNNSAVALRRYIDPFFESQDGRKTRAGITFAQTCHADAGYRLVVLSEEYDVSMSILDVLFGSMLRTRSNFTLSGFSNKYYRCHDPAFERTGVASLEAFTRKSILDRSPVSIECREPTKIHDFEEIVGKPLRDGVLTALREEVELYVMLRAEFYAHLAESQLGLAVGPCSDCPL